MSSPLEGERLERLIASACRTAEDLGAAVFPVRVEPDPADPAKSTKRPLIKGWQNGAAVSNPEAIEALFREHAGAVTHAGIQTGRIVVIDLDGEQAQSWWRDHIDILPMTRTVDTRRPGGKHLFYRVPTHVELRNSAGKIAPGVDFRGVGGFVVDWSSEHPPAVEDVADAPAALIEFLRNASSSREKPNSTGGAEDGSIPPGGRNDYLSREAFRLRKQGASVEQILIALRGINEARCRPPLDESEVRQIAEGKAHVEAEITGDSEAEEKKSESQASTLVAFVRDRCRLVHDENGDVYAIENTTGEVRNIERRAFKVWLHAEFYKATEKAARSQSIAEALTTLAGIGLHDGELVEVNIRCAALGEGYVIDLGEPGKSRAIVVSPGSWTVTEHHGVMFVRPDNMKPLPEPVGGGNLDALWPLVNVPKESRLLVLTWLLECLRPDTPFPLLEAIGEQGSAKSALQKLLKRLIDPSSIELRSAPKSGEDIFVGAGQGWLLAYDNVSHFSADLQDVLCRVATGATFATRKLYTNAEESAIRAKRPVTLNGIGASITAQDLVDRAISLELPVVEDRREAAGIEADFDRLHSALLGALLDLFAKALSILPRIAIERDRRPRLIEFGKLGCAVAQATGRTADDFLAEFEAMRAESIGRTLDASPVAVALIEFLEDRADREGERSAKQWYEALTKPDGAEAWPRSPKGFSDALRRAAPALRTMGIHVSRPRKSHGSKVISITRKVAAPKSPMSPTSPEPSAASAGGNHSGDFGDFGDFTPASISAEDEDQELLL